MTKRQRQTLNQSRKHVSEISWLVGENSIWLNAGTRRYMRRRANKAERRYGRAICKDGIDNWQRLPGCSRTLRTAA